MQVVKRSSYRQRVYQGIDNSITLVFGSDSVPVNVDGTEMKLLADHDIVESIIVTDHKE